MPLYKVRCDRCGRKEEVLRLASNAWEVIHDYGEPCPVANCGGRMWPVPAVSHAQFKGNGWSTPSARAEDKSNQEV